MRQALELNIRAIIGRAYVRVVGVNRELSWVIFDIILPLLGVAAYVYIYRALQAPPEFSGFVILGGAMTAYWLNVLWSMASQFYWEKERGHLELLLLAPASRISILLGMALGGMFATTVRAGSVIFLGAVIFGVDLRPQRPAELVLLFLLTMIALYGLGMLFASLFLLWGREAWHTSNLLQEPIYLVSGFYFPVKSLNFWLAIGASIIPLTLGLDGMRQLIFGVKAQGFLAVEIEIAVLTVLSVVFLYLAAKALGYMEALAKREGRLTLRGQ